MPVAIWAPHGDDELIGCYSVLTTRAVGLVTVYYGSIDEGCLKASLMFGFPYHNFYEKAAAVWDLWDIVYAPDPDYDVHPEHQWFGSMARRYFRTGRINRLIHYTTQMSAPYISEVESPIEKRDALNECYPLKSDLWRYDHRYWLFEGYCELLRLDHT
jgi:hypothetical protein